jgi:hypothetical protein
MSNKVQTFWLIVTSTASPRILADKVKRVDGTTKEVTDARNQYAVELGEGYIVTAETDREARLYQSYRRFRGSDREAYS